MILLEVPFAEKDAAKSLGARWNPMEKKWYVPESLADDLTPFERWLPNQSPLSIVDSPLSPEAIPANDKEKGITLSQLMFQVQSALRQSFPGAVWVKAEIANLNERRGHIYLELTETTENGGAVATCRAMIWQSQVSRILDTFVTETGSELKPGQKVLLLAEVNFHEKFGFSLVVQDVDPSFTLGELEANINKIRKQLIDEQLYERNKQFSMPTDFFSVAVIAPPNAAGLGDFRADADLLQHTGLCEFKYFYSAFQGKQVESEMLAAFDAFQALYEANSFDALIIIRGGGAKLDLMPLNAYQLAKAIAMAPIPVLTGIGHERDNTLLDEVAAVRFDTPSKVIAGIRQTIFEGAQKAQAHWLTIERSSQLYVQKQKQILSEMEKTVQRQSLNITEQLKRLLVPLHYQIQRQSLGFIQTQKHILLQSNQEIKHHVSSQLQLQKQQLIQYKDTIDKVPFQQLEKARVLNKQWIRFVLSSGPKTQLNRGFAIVKNKKGGTPIKSAEVAKRQSQIEITFKDGAIQAIPVEE